MRLYLLALLSLVAVPAWANPLDECSSSRDIPVSVTVRFDNPTYDYNYGIPAIQGMMSEADHHIQETIALGLTRYEPTIGLSLPIVGIALPSKLVCAHVEKVDIDISYGQVTVFVANEIPQGSCGFREIMAHEQKHIDVNRQVLNEYAPRIKASVKNYIQSRGVFREQTAEYAESVLNQDLNNLIHTELAAMAAENSRRQMLVDSHDEYLRITNSCNGEIARVSLQYLEKLKGYGSAP